MEQMTMDSFLDSLDGFLDKQLGKDKWQYNYGVDNDVLYISFICDYELFEDAKEEDEDEVHVGHEHQEGVYDH